MDKRTLFLLLSFIILIAGVIIVAYLVLTGAQNKELKICPDQSAVHLDCAEGYHQGPYMHEGCSVQACIDLNGNLSPQYEL